MPHPSNTSLIQTVDGSLAILTLNRPLKLNAIDEAMWRTIPKAIEDLSNTPNVRAIIINGAEGKAFSVGADIGEFNENRSGTRAKAYETLNHQAFQSILNCPLPTIALVDGFCLGGGFLLALCCDVRLGSSKAQVSIPPAKLGLGFHPFWFQIMLRTMSLATCKNLLFTGQRMKAKQAYMVGALNDLYEQDQFETQAKVYCEMVCENAPLTIAAGKKALDQLYNEQLAIGAPDDPRLASMTKEADACFGSNDYARGKTAFKEKQKPQFQGD